MFSKKFILFLFYYLIQGGYSNQILGKSNYQLNDTHGIDFKGQRKALIFPGTYWCGPGNISLDNNSLGVLSKVDACCREHDRCPDYIPAGQSKYGLTNTAFHSKLECSCDQIFYDCLKTNSDKSSDIIGGIYFNILNTQCYKYDYPIIGCDKYVDDCKKKCSSYVFNTNAPKKYQWFDEPKY